MRTSVPSLSSSVQGTIACTVTNVHPSFLKWTALYFGSCLQALAQPNSEAVGGRYPNATLWVICLWKCLLKCVFITLPYTPGTNNETRCSILNILMYTRNMIGRISNRWVGEMAMYIIVLHTASRLSFNHSMVPELLSVGYKKYCSRMCMA